MFEKRAQDDYNPCLNCLFAKTLRQTVIVQSDSLVSRPGRDKNTEMIRQFPPNTGRSTKELLFLTSTPVEKIRDAFIADT